MHNYCSESFCNILGFQLRDNKTFAPTESADRSAMNRIFIRRSVSCADGSEYFAVFCLFCYAWAPLMTYWVITGMLKIKNIE